jgi:hypothetical protein
MGNDKNSIEVLYFDYLKECLNDTLFDFKEYALSDSRYRYAVNNTEKIDFLQKCKHDYIIDNFNFLNVKGVKYLNGQYELIVDEVKELMLYYGVDLKNETGKLFESKNDLQKPYAYKSFVQVSFALSYCLKLQIINELIREFTEPQPKYNTGYLHIFKLNGFELFQYLDEHFEIKSQTVKYTLIFHFIDDKKLIIGTREKYLEFVKPYLEPNLKFSRLDFLHRTDEKYKTHLQHITSLYKDFSKPQ